MTKGGSVKLEPRPDNSAIDVAELQTDASNALNLSESDNDEYLEDVVGDFISFPSDRDPEDASVGSVGPIATPAQKATNLICPFSC